MVCSCILDGSVGGVGGSSGGEIVLGSVNGSFCARCYADGVPSLCNHKQAVRGDERCCRPRTPERLDFLHKPVACSRVFVHPSLVCVYP